MNIKKIFSIVLACVLLVGLIVPCFPARAAHEHTYGAWTIDTAKGTQSRTCSGCSDVQTLYGTTNMVEQVKEPAIGGQYYLAANVAGTVQYFAFGSSTTDTTPYSLHVSTDTAKATQITLEDPTKATEGTSVGFQMTFSGKNGTLTRIYCYDSLSSGENKGIMDTGHNTANYKGRHTFEIAEVGGVKVLRKLSNNNILVVKYNETKKAWRMLGVPEAELANAGVYPAMLVTNHTHAYSATYESNATKHWKACDCGAKVEEADHTYGAWTIDTAKGTQSKLCTVCHYVGQTLHGTTNKATQVTAPTIGSTYYLAANVNGVLKYFYLSGSVTATSPYSLNTTENPALSKPVTLAAAVEPGKGEFQLDYDDNGTARVIYCIPTGSFNTGTTSKYASNGTSYGSYYTANRATFSMDEVNGVKVLRKYSNNAVLAVKQLTHVNGSTVSYRLVGVAENELANEGVYPVMLVENHTHTAGTKYEFNETQHWQLCDCGDIATEKVSHTFVEGKCVCGAENTQHECKNTDNIWHSAGDEHYQLCGICGEAINKAAHTYGGWTFDTAKGTQSKLCTVCQAQGETLHGTTNKVSQVTAPTVGSEYYMVVNVNGDIRSFITGSYTQTTPYSIITSETLNKVTVAAALQAGKGEFQLVHGGEFLVYSVAAGVGLSRSASYVTDPAKVSFSMDTVNGEAVLRAFGTGKILAAKWNDAKAQWRIYPVEDNEIGSNGVYPVMLANLHTHNYGTTYEQDETGHWQSCSCGYSTEKTGHIYTNGTCTCGKTEPVHDCASADGKWYADGDKHHQICGICFQKINEADHTLGEWVFDTTKGEQHKNCTVCNAAGESLYGTTDKVSQVTAPTVGSKYYLVANVNGTLYSFISGGVTETNPYSLRTSATLAEVTIKAALEAGKGEFQMESAENMLFYSIDAGAGLTRSASYVNDPNKVSFSMDQVNGKTVIRAFGTKKILAAKYCAEKSTWRIYAVDASELANEGVHPVMLANQHTHSYSASYEQDEHTHWKNCNCGSTTTKEKHKYVNDVCVCGKNMPVHTCQSADGKWYEESGKHYQLCDICQEQIGLAEHTYGAWVFDTAKGIQSATCSVCNQAKTLHGTTEKGYQVLDAKIGQKYYLAANVDGKLRFFYQGGSTTNTVPYSLYVTDDLKKAQEVALEDYTAVTSTAVADKGFQMTWPNPDTTSAAKTLRIYCYNSETTNPAMDTGHNGNNTANGHTFFLDEENGVKVIRKFANNNVLVVKFDPMVDAYRMLGVPASELGQEGVYPAMLLTMHEHTHTDTTYQKDALGHWFACECGGKSNYADHTVSKWTYTKKPTQTSGGQKTGTCTVCGGKAVVDVPALVEEGHYYLTGTLGGKTYYFRPQTGGESVEDTIPFSLMSTTKEKEAMKVNVVWDEKSNTYVLNFTETRTLNIYMDDVNGNTVKKDGKVDLSASATTAENRILFRWDPVNKRFFQIENGERYVMAFKKMTFADGKTQAVRMLAVPETELSSTVVPVQLKTVHIHAFGSKWSSDALNHWHECSCGMHKDEAAHDVSKWTVEKKATTSAAGKKSGICSGCGMKVVQAIPMLTDKIKAPKNGVTYYLTGTLNGKQHYFTHTPSGGSVADTYPYSVYTDPGTGVVTPVRVVEKNGTYKLSYLRSDLYIYISGDGVGMTSKVDNATLVDYQWDEEYKVLYQLEGDVKHVLVMKMLRNEKGKNLVRITSMPLDQALIDPNVAIVRLSTQAPDVIDPNANGPQDATPLGYVSEAPANGDASQVQPDYLAKQKTKEAEKDRKLIVAGTIAAILIPLLLVLLLVLKNTSAGLAFFRGRNLWAGLAIIAAGIVLLVAIFLPQQEKEETLGLESFTIVANNSSMETAQALSVEIYEKHGIRLPVVHGKDFAGDYGIYLNCTGFNSYGGYKYRIANQNDDKGTNVYIDGTGVALDTAVSKWLKSANKTTEFPFGIEKETIGYEWNTGDVNMTALGFTMTEMTSRDLYEGVQMRELKYESFAYGKNNAYALIIDSDAPVELKVSAGEWDENTTTDNPGEKFTVAEHSKRLADKGYEVLAITNAGFYDLNTTMTYIPWGMQIVDGIVKKEPNKDNPKNTDNWFGQTADGKYVISNTDGYPEYETKISDGVGGGLMLMKDGKPCFTGTTPDFRTVVGVTKDGDLVILTISGANYAVVTQAFMDMGLEMDCVLNLDGGGSTTLHARNEEGNLQQYICETTIEREVADAISIVKKKD